MITFGGHTAVLYIQQSVATSRAFCGCLVIQGGSVGLVNKLWAGWSGVVFQNVQTDFGSHTPSHPRANGDKMTCEWNDYFHLLPRLEYGYVFLLILYAFRACTKTNLRFAFGQWIFSDQVSRLSTGHGHSTLGLSASLQFLLRVQGPTINSVHAIKMTQYFRRLCVTLTVISACPARETAHNKRCDLSRRRLDIPALNQHSKTYIGSAFFESQLRRQPPSVGTFMLFFFQSLETNPGIIPRLW